LNRLVKNFPVKTSGESIKHAQGVNKRVATKQGFTGILPVSNSLKASAAKLKQLRGMAKSISLAQNISSNQDTLIFNLNQRRI